MSTQAYENQVTLLLSILPEVDKETCFALHGGTAINLFVRNMPRLSVDIDLTYLPLEDRATSLQGINNGLIRIKKAIELLLKNVRVQHLEREAKLLVSNRKASIKIEVNLIKRGCYETPQKLELCTKAQDSFDVYTEINVVEQGHLFGGKIVAALDRQHPRDLFDIKYMLETEGFSPEIKKGFIFYLISSNRPIREILFPRLQDQKVAFENQFTGMTNENFKYSEYEDVRISLLNAVHLNLNSADKAFLLNIEKAEPDWNLYDFNQFPAVQWKLQNLQKLKKQNPGKYRELYEALENNFKKAGNSNQSD